MIASVQAPVIMMSQNRLSSKDRLKSDLDYEVNLKAELEVAHLHRKVDHIYERIEDHFARLDRNNQAIDCFRYSHKFSDVMVLPRVATVFKRGTLVVAI